MLSSLSQAAGGQQVKDMTGLTGNYQVAIGFSLADLMNMAARSGEWPYRVCPQRHPRRPRRATRHPIQGGSSTLVQAVQSLGLKLESRKAVVEQLVIDHVEKTPTE